MAYPCIGQDDHREKFHATILSCLILAGALAGCVVYERPGYGPRYGYYGGYGGYGYNGGGHHRYDYDR